jgi:hypothetical protein
VSAEVVAQVGWSGYWAATALLFAPAAAIFLMLPTDDDRLSRAAESPTVAP